MPFTRGAKVPSHLNILPRLLSRFENSEITQREERKKEMVHKGSKIPAATVISRMHFCGPDRKNRSCDEIGAEKKSNIYVKRSMLLPPLTRS